MTINLYAAWICFLLGTVVGATTGLFFHREEWLGGYTSWRRRMLRLGHISFFGIGLLNLAFALSAPALGIADALELSSYLLILGAVGMPLVCYLSAVHTPFRHLFFIPAGAVMVALAAFVWRILAS
ncbi:MAG: hypothetical protein P8125_11940 [Gemmatimonadota bacterium]|jgi:hypothetical protein